MPLTFFQCAKSFVQTFTGIASEDFNDFVLQHLEDGSDSQHGTAVSFFEGSFLSAMSASSDPKDRTEGRKLLLLWLHEKDDADAEYLCQSLWTDPAIAAELAGRILPWAGDVCRYEAAALCRAVRATCPALVLIKVCSAGTPGAIEWPRGSYFQVLHLKSGRVSAMELLNLLKSVADQQDFEQQLQRQWQESVLHLQQLGQNMARAMDEAQHAQQRLEALRACEEEEGPCWGALFESRFEVPPPKNFHQGSFADAHAAARARKKLLLIWLESSEPSTFDARLMAGEVFEAFVQEYFVLWPGNAEKWLVPVQLKEMLRLENLPCFVILEPLSVFEVEVFPWSDPRSGTVEFPIDCAWNCLGVLHPPDLTEDTLMTFLSQHGDAAKERQQHAEVRRQEQQLRADEARRLREEQDKEYQESLKRDQQRLGMPTTQETALCRARRNAARELPEEAKQGKKGDTCQLVLRFPCGRRAERRFGAEEMLSEVYRWADCAGELASLSGSGFDVPEKFVLATTYPKSVLKDQKKTLRQLKLVPSAVLTVCPE